MKRIKKTVLLGLTVLSFSTIKAQEDKKEEKKISLSGSIDAYYQTNLSAADNISQSFGTSFANELGYALGMANVVAGYKGDKSGIVADITFGPRGDEATGSYKVESLTIKPEFRIDTWGNVKPYVGSDGALSDNLSSFLIAAIYSF